MARLDYPWHMPNIKYGQNLVVNFIIFILVLVFYAVIGIVALIILVIDLILSAKSNRGCDETNVNSPKTQASTLFPNNQINTSCDRRESRTWLVLVDDEKCDYVRAFDQHGYVYLNTQNRKLQVDDTVFLYVATKRKIRYETLVVGVGVPRGDEKYWVVSPPNGLTCKLQKVAEYKGRELTKSKLKAYGFKGESSIRLPICNNIELMDYIEETFLDYSLK